MPSVPISIPDEQGPVGGDGRSRDHEDRAHARVTDECVGRSIVPHDRFVFGPFAFGLLDLGLLDLDRLATALLVRGCPSNAC